MLASLAARGASCLAAAAAAASRHVGTPDHISYRCPSLPGTHHNFGPIITLCSVAFNAVLHCTATQERCAGPCPGIPDA